MKKIIGWTLFVIGLICISIGIEIIWSSVIMVLGIGISQYKFTRSSNIKDNILKSQNIKKNKKIDKIKIKGRIGLILTFSGFAFALTTQVRHLAGYFVNDILFVLLFIFIALVGMYLSTPYLGKVMKEGEW